MNEAIQQKIIFKEATAEELFDIFLNPQKHSAIHGGAKTRITEKEGDTFSLLNGNLTGKNLMIVPGKMIVQSWKGNVWQVSDPDSILILIFSNTKEGGQIEMVHAFTPNQFAEMWDEVYWQPIKQFFKEQSKK